MFNRFKLIAWIFLAVMLAGSAVHAETTATLGAMDTSGNYDFAVIDHVLTPNQSAAGVKTLVEVATTSDTVTATESGKTFMVECTVPCTFTLPTAVAGLEYTFVSTGTAGVQFYVDSASTDTLVGVVNDNATTTFAAGDKIISQGYTGDSGHVVAGEALKWHVVDLRGTWTDNN